MSNFLNQINQALQSIRFREDRKIDSAIILGSGLNNFDMELENKVEFNYQDIDNLPATSIVSHQGRLVIGNRNGQCIAICHGRHHLYEGFNAQQVCMLTYILAKLGTSRLVITNAAGALNPAYSPGDIMLLNDHINFTGCNPIIGQDDSLGNRFTDMSNAYDLSLIKLAIDAAKKQEITLHEGVYAGVLGPSLETSAERRMLKVLGADAVGMSTVMEVVAANQCNIQVLGLSAITNMALGNETQEIDTIEKVLHNAAIASLGIKKIINAVV